MPTMRAASRTRAGICAESTPWFSKEKATSSATVNPTNWAEVSCITVPTFVATSTRVVRAGSRP